MKIRCGSHQQNRSIVRPGLSLMAAKVALTAEEFRENSQRSIALFNTEKLSTNSTHVLKSAYCNSVHFCRCNLHGACGGKGCSLTSKASEKSVAICTERVEAKGLRHDLDVRRDVVAICTERVEAKFSGYNAIITARWLQSARSVWRQRGTPCCKKLKLSLQSARSVWRQSKRGLQNFCCRIPLQSARSVWRQRRITIWS